MTLQLFLKTCRANLIKLHAFDRVGVVLGTEACDLDAAISTLLTSYLKQKIKDEIVLPVMNVRRTDLQLKTEVKYLLETSGIFFESLICRDEIDIEILHRQGKLSLTLVDHNVLSPTDEGLESSVTEIIDHHKEEHGNRFPRAKITIEPVGSCATLVAEFIINERKELIDAQVARMLWGTILIDTVCLSTSAQRTTEKDRVIINHLESVLGHSEREEMFQELQNAKCNTDGLTAEQILRKDLKTIQKGTIIIAISTVPILLEDFLKNTNKEELLKFCHDNPYNCLIVMSFVTDGKTIRRQLAVFSPIAVLAKKISEFLEKSDLELCAFSLEAIGAYCFEQGKQSASRKVVLPLLRNYLEDSFHLQQLEEIIQHR